jgi:PKD repeat protein
MERIASIMLLAICLVGTGYLYMENVDRLAADEAAAAVVAEEAATAAAAAEVEAAKIKFTIPHDSDNSTTSIVVTLDGSGSSDNNGDALAYQWTLVDGDAVLNSDSTDVTTFSASAGEYTINLTVTDNYGASSSDEKIVTVEKEPNDAPEVQIVASQE